MFDVATIKKVSLSEDFRENFPEFKDIYSQIDAYGGSNCSSCNLRKQKNLFRKISQEIILNEELKNRYSRFFKTSDIELTPVREVNLAALPYDIKKFSKLFFFREVRDLFEEFFPEDYATIKDLMDDRGLYDESLEPFILELKNKIYSSLPMFQKLYNLLTTSNIHSKIMSESLSCKIIMGFSIADLENKINEFCLGRPVVSVNKDELHAIILYR